MDLTQFKLYRRLRRLLGHPLQAGSFLPEGYFILADLMEGRLVLQLMRDDNGWREEVVEVFEPQAPLDLIQKRALIDQLSRLN